MLMIDAAFGTLLLTRKPIHGPLSVLIPKLNQETTLMARHASIVSFNNI